MATTFFTNVECRVLPVQISLGDKTMVLGSCFADSIGGKLREAGFDVMTNPFGTLYNPLSIADAILRMTSGREFVAEDCRRMGAGSKLVCSFHHHTSFARETEEEFLDNANAKLAEAAEFWHSCNKLIITLGTARVWKCADDGMAVANCLKRPAAEFTHDLLGLDEATAAIREIGACGKEIIFTVSPIRHLGEGAHDNTLSKATLQLAIHKAGCPNACYFPSYEILLDELRDYRFYAEDMVHPSDVAVRHIWQKFVEAAVPQKEWQRIAINEKTARREAHRPLH